MYPISDLTAFCRRTTGYVPPKLVGASTTVIGSKMYLYGGRLVSERKMVSDIYVFDFETFRWDRIPQSPSDDIPQARYFHSADTWRNHLIIFGGMAIKPQSDNPEDLCVLNDVRLFDLTTGHWLPAATTSGDSSLIPNARYAHLSSVTADRLFIIGGQDLDNVWLDDVYIYDLATKVWVQRREYARHCGTYRSVAVTADTRVRLPQEELRTGQASSSLGPPGTRFKVNKAAPPTAQVTQSESLVHLPYSAPPTDEYPCDIFLFSNYNFTDVQRELEVFSPLSDGDFTVSDRSASMTGTSFPPGLRFPTGAILGTHFIVAGTYLSQTYQSFSIWALDLINMTWSRIDPGSALAMGSWFRSCLWPAANKFMVFGNRHGNLVEDYNRRLLSWDHVTCIDLEAFGIYQPPFPVLDVPSQELGLAAFEEGVLTDFEVVCDDGRKIRCSRKMLEERWPWFKERQRRFVQAAKREAEAMPTIPEHIPLPDLPGGYDGQDPRPDPRLTPRAFHLSEPYPITLALVQYFYSMALITPLQHAPAVLTQLLLLSSTYELAHLQSLVKHAMHRALSYATSVGIYGVSTLCGCRSLQIRALRVVMAYSQKRPPGSRARPDKDGSSGGKPPDSTNGSGNGADGAGGGGGGPSEPPSAARPRGMSDASYMRGSSEGGAGGANVGYSNASNPVPSAESDANSLVTLRPRAMSEVVYSTSQLPSQRAAGSFRPATAVATKVYNPPARPSKRPSMASAVPSPSSSRRTSRSSHRSSAVSLSTDRELCAIVELMSPTIETDENASRTPVYGSRSRANSLLDVYRSTELAQVQCVDVDPLSSLSSLSASSSSLNAESTQDDFCQAAVYSPVQAAFPAFHLPSTPRRPTWDGESLPSLKTSTSYSSLSTPSLSRTSSFHRSPPVSPTAATLSTPVDMTPVSAHGHLVLEAIEEVNPPEDAESPRDLFYSDARGNSSLPNLSMQAQPGSVHECGPSQEVAQERSRSDSQPAREHQVHRPKTANVASAVAVSSSRSGSPAQHVSRTMINRSKRSASNAIARLFTKDVKKTQTVEHLFHFNGSALNLSMAKAEEKKRKKAAARAQIDKLAIENLRSPLEVHAQRNDRLCH